MRGNALTLTRGWKGGTRWGGMKELNSLQPLIPLPGWIKISRIKDKETGVVGEGIVWDWESYEKADAKAWKDLQQKLKGLEREKMKKDC